MLIGTKDYYTFTQRAAGWPLSVFFMLLPYDSQSKLHYPLRLHSTNVIGFCTKKDGRKPSTTSYRICGNLPSEFLDIFHRQTSRLSDDSHIHSKEFELPGSLCVGLLTTFFTSTRQSSGFAHFTCRCNLTS